jgi:hypothetical protein
VAFDTGGSRLSLRFDAAARRHSATTYLAPAATAPWAFATAPGEVVVTPGSYTSRDVHEIDALDAVWTFPTVQRSDAFGAGRSYTRRIGGEVRTSLEDVREQAAPDLSVDWDATDAFGNRLAGVLESEAAPADLAPVVRLAEVARDRGVEHRPRLRLYDPSGTDVRAGTVPWDQRPFGFGLPAPSVAPGEHELELRVETGPSSDRREERAELIVPARAIDEQGIEPGDRFDVQVVLDAPRDDDAAFSVRETLPPGFSVVGDDGVWTCGRAGTGRARRSSSSTRSGSARTSRRAPTASPATSATTRPAPCGRSPAPRR